MRYSSAGRLEERGSNLRVVVYAGGRPCDAGSYLRETVRDNNSVARRQANKVMTAFWSRSASSVRRRAASRKAEAAAFDDIVARNGATPTCVDTSRSPGLFRTSGRRCPVGDVADVRVGGGQVVRQRPDGARARPARGSGRRPARWCSARWIVSASTVSRNDRSQRSAPRAPRTRGRRRGLDYRDEVLGRFEDVVTTAFHTSRSLKPGRTSESSGSDFGADADYGSTNGHPHDVLPATVT
jgi:hypothetical protein